MKEFKIGECYSREEIHNELGGSVQSYLPTVDGIVTCICVTENFNPSFNEKYRFEKIKHIFVGKGELRTENARQLRNQSKELIPTFIKLSSGSWKYLGNYEFKDVFFNDRERINEIGSRYGRTAKDLNDVAGILTIEVVPEKAKIIKRKAA